MKLFCGDHHPIWHQSLAMTIDRLSCQVIDQQKLMERAAAGVVEAIPREKIDEAKVVVFVGPGNNGGDAKIIAQLLAPKTENVEIFHFPFQQADVKRISQILAGEQSKLIIDGLFGINFQRRKTSKELKAIARLVNESTNSYVVAVDLPSGLECDEFSGGSAFFPAHLTVTFGAKKICTVISKARDQCGEVVVKDPGFTKGAIVEGLKKDPMYFYEIDEKKLLGQNPFDALPKSAHKYDRGHVLVIGGSKGKLGAPILTALAAYRTGAGWVSLALPEKAKLGLVPIECTLEDFFIGGKLNAKELRKFLKTRRVACVAIGPGMMKSPLKKDSLKVLGEFVEEGGRLVVDAGATAGWLDFGMKWNEDRVVLTPHPGEWRKLKKNGCEVLRNREDVLRFQKSLKKSGGTWVYKNATPLIFNHESKVFVCTTGSNSNGKAGSGDVLTGIIAAHLAVGGDAEFAAARGLSVLGDAGARAVEVFGRHSLMASDLI